MPRKIGVLIIDDSALMRRQLTKIIESDPMLRVVGTARDAVEGIEKVRQLQPDIVTIDLVLPGMDGLTCLQHIMVESPRPCIMISAYTGRNAVETFKALDLGAVDFVEKPSGEISRDINKISSVIRSKIRGAALANLSNIRRGDVAVAREKSVGASQSDSKFPKRLVVIGVSTGGPRTLGQIIPQLPHDLGVPVIVVQHMPGKFTGQFAERMNRMSRIEVHEASDGELLRNNIVYIAPGDFHLCLIRVHGQVYLKLKPPEASDLIIPSVDVTLDSAIDLFGSQVIGVILTGMGDDGARSIRRLYDIGGLTIAESKESAVIYGMPAAVVSDGAARIIAPAQDIARRILEALGDGESTG